MKSATPEQLNAVTPELDLGERAAIALATTFSADLLLIHDARGRAEAPSTPTRHHRHTGVLRAAAERGLIDVPETLARLRVTSFYIDNGLISELFDRRTN